MRSPCLTLTLLLALAAPATAGEISADDIQRDLELTAWLTSKATVVPGEPVRLGATITNRSQTRSYALVRPGDGSEIGWREPHVFFTAVWRSPRDGHLPVEENAWGRCGMHDANWQDAIVTLAPGEKLDLSMNLMAASTFLDFQREGRTEIRLHYRWSGGRTHKGGPDAVPAPELGKMEGTPPFELVSKPVALDVHRPVEVAVTVTESLRVGDTRTLADLLRVSVRNRTNDPLEFRPQHVQFVLDSIEPADLLALREDVDPQARVRAAPLAAHAERTFEGAAAFRLLRHLRLRARTVGTLQLAAVYAPGAWDRSSNRSPIRIRSPWVTIQVEPSARTSTERTTVVYGLTPTRTFSIADTDVRGVSLADLAKALKTHRRRHPNSEYEVKAEVKVTPDEVQRIRAAFGNAEARLTHFWVPVGDHPGGTTKSGPHGPGYVDLLE